MNKKRFRLLVFLMSLSLIGIILVQIFWINTSLNNNKEQFKYHIQQVLGNVDSQLSDRELYAFYKDYRRLEDSLGVMPEKNILKQVYIKQRNKETNETIIYTNTLIAESFDIDGSFFGIGKDSLKIGKVISNRKTEIFKNNRLDDNSQQIQTKPDEIIEYSGSDYALDKANFEIVFRDIVSQNPLHQRIDITSLEKILKRELDKYGVKTHFEFGIYSNGLATKVKSERFKFVKDETYGVPIFQDNNGNSSYQLLLTFPHKSRYLFSSLIGVTLLSLLFTIIIVLTYISALNQLLKQKQISEIKTDFINNMTHEFKTPIATINLALDAIRNPKIIDDPEKVKRYLGMIKEENKRMHAQVENVLRISKLEKNELDIDKENTDINEIIQDALDHISLIVEDRQGSITCDLNAKRTNVLLNDMHFTNVLVNVLDNAIKYSPNQPIINLATENIKDFLVIKISDKGSGMSKVAQKRVFEKFYREHTGDIHNVKGHGLGLSYVKQIIEDHNGTVYVESEKGKGSTFFIKIPLIN